MTEQQKVYKYWYMLRPPSYAHQPKGQIEMEGGIPKQIWHAGFGEVYSFGWVTYPEPLPFDQAWHFDLIPDDPVEWAHHEFWMFAGRDLERAEVMEQDYLAAYRKDPDFERWHCPRDLRKPIQILAEHTAGGQSEQFTGA